MRIAFRTHDLGVKSLDGAVEKCKACNIDAVQLVAYKFLDFVKYEPNGIDEEKAKLIGKAFAEAGIGIPLIGAYFNPVHSDAQKAERCKQVFKDYIDMARLLGADIVGSESGSFNDDKWTYNPQNRTKEAFDKVVKTFSELAVYAKNKGIYIGMEGAAGHVLWNVETLKRAVDRIDMDNVRVIFDIYNYLDAGNYSDYLQILKDGLKTFAGKIRVFHIKDCVFDDGKLRQVAPGKGMFDFEKILGLIKSYDREATLVLEGTTGEDIVPCTQFIRQVWDKV